MSQMSQISNPFTLNVYGEQVEINPPNSGSKVHHPGPDLSNTIIARDEEVHTKFAVEMCRRTMTEEKIDEIARQAVEESMKDHDSEPEPEPEPESEPKHVKKTVREELLRKMLDKEPLNEEEKQEHLKFFGRSYTGQDFLPSFNELDEEGKQYMLKLLGSDSGACTNNEKTQLSNSALRDDLLNKGYQQICLAEEQITKKIKKKGNPKKKRGLQNKLRKIKKKKKEVEGEMKKYGLTY